MTVSFFSQNFQMIIMIFLVDSKTVGVPEPPFWLHTELLGQKMGGLLRLLVLLQSPSPRLWHPIRVDHKLCASTYSVTGRTSEQCHQPLRNVSVNGKNASASDY